MKIGISLFAAIALLLMSTSAWAQQGVITLDDTVIKGRIQKPEAFYILQNATLSYEGITFPPSFVEEIEESVDGDPF